jgi:hypothetical protein
MGTLAIRQGTPLYFARSLVWCVIMSEYNEDEIKNLPEAVKYERFLTAWERHLKAGLDPSQHEADRIAALYHTTAKVAPKPTERRTSFAVTDTTPTNRRRRI